MQNGSPYAYQSGIGGGGSTVASGGTGKNYLGTINGVNNNGDFEGGTTNKWSLGTTGTLTNGLPTGTPTFGSGASGNLSIAAFNSSPLAGSWSLRYASSAATTAGNCLASDAFTIDLEDQAKVMTVKFYYRAQVNPTNGNWSGTSSNSFAWAIYDVTNSVWIAPAGSFGMTQSSGVGICTGTFQTSASGTQYRLVVYNANATSGAVTVIFDDFFVGPQTAPIGALITDTKGFTPTGSWTANTTYTGNWFQRGDRAVITWGLALSGAPTAANLTLNLPPGLVIDTSKLTNSGGSFHIHGTANGLDSSASTAVPGIPLFKSSTEIYVAYNNAAATQALYTNSAPITWASGDRIEVTVEVPIVGWASNVQMSSDTDTRVVAAYIPGTGSTQSIANAATAKITTYGTASIDTHGAWDSANSRYIAPVTGIYSVSGGVAYNGTTWAAAGSSNANLQLYKNGSPSLTLDAYQSPTANSHWVYLRGTVQIRLNAGDYIEMYSANSAGNSANVSVSYLNVQRLSGPSVIAASESVNARYTNSAGTAIGTSFGVIPFANKVYDSHDVYNPSTGIYTVPVSGKYAIKCTIQTVAVNLATSQGCAIAVFKNGSEYGYLGSTPGTGVSATKAPSGSDTIDCLAGDQLAIYSVSDVATTLVATASRNHVAIERVGN